ncbi:MAG: restriction endonuclease subunit S, partial [Desulfamplus sp.]|nr:restriction endonuclease subunit S [Desulfamplus sp.]
IMEYDTLTSEDRWNEYADVILANPPFMSPKGGISPHKKFSVQSKRSEVLFVDYIAEHLTPFGRAGVIVPEGIIFQGGNAYKQLRKMLVENYLYAVVSLPAGIFNPYSGVKTSILLMDRLLAKRCDSILFVKIENDGFGLGAQRREMAGSDLPDAVNVISDYVKAVRSDSPDTFKPEEKPCGALVVKKEKLAENGEYNLTGERYRVVERKGKQKWEMVRLGEVARIINGRAYKQEELLSDGKYPVLRVGNFFSNSNWYYSDLELERDKYCDNGDLLYAWSASFGPKIWNGGKVIYHYHIWKIEPSDIVNKLFLYHVLNRETESIKSDGGRGIAMLHITKSGMEARQFPLPPLEVQQEIISEIEGYQKLIDGARQVVDSWKPQIEINPEWEMVRLGEVCEITSSKRIFQEEYVTSGIPFYRTKEIVELSHGKDISLELFISENRFNQIKEQFGSPQKNDILVSAVGTIGVSWVVSDDRQFYFKDGNLLWLRKFKNADVHFIKNILDINIKYNLHLLTNGAAYNALTIVKLKNLLIPLPPLEVQQEIVAEIEAERKAVDGCRELIKTYEEKIKRVVDRVWEE